MDSIISTSDLTKVYQRSHLGKVYKTPGINKVNIEIQRNEIFGLLGLNGSGKTTTIKLILGLLFPTGGTIHAFGRIMPDKTSISKIGYLPEIPYFQRFLTGKEILNFYCELSGIDPGKINSVIESVVKTVDMEQHINKRISEFSKGMLQRLGIAQSMLHDPDLFVFDEPITGLDPLGIREMRNFILSLRTNGKTVFFSSHIVSEAEKICDRVGILHKGELKRVIQKKEWSVKPLEEIFIESIQ
jgi:ABC-2 type transport system ATP-binding protein